MTTRVEVDFRGLCLFVPGEASDGSAVLHVLFPVTNAANFVGLQNSNIPEHLPRVVYSLDYESTSCPPKHRRVNTNKHTVKDVERVLDLNCFPIIDWSRFGKPVQQLQIPVQIVDVTDLAKNATPPSTDPNVRDDCIGASLPNSGPCAARVTLPGSVTITPYNVRKLSFTPDGGNGQPIGGERDVAPCVLCVFETDATMLNLPVDGHRTLCESGGVIRVMFGNLMPGDYEHPPQPSPPKGTHFGAFYSMLNKAPSHPPLPIGGPHGASPFVVSCMLAQGRILG